MSRPYEGQIVWIIGASSGIGHALARQLADQGAVLALSARRKNELDALKGQLGEHHKVFALDVTHMEMVERTALAVRASLGRVDRVIFLSASYMPMTVDALDMAVTRQIVDVNLMGAFHVLHAVLPILKEQGAGQIALCGSVAGYTGLPNGQPYSATKAAIMNLAESLAAESQGAFDVKLISPGFVKTPMTDKNNFAMPMMVTPEVAAQAIAKGLLTRRFEIHFPKRFTLWMKILCALPYCTALAITKRIKA